MLTLYALVYIFRCDQTDHALVYIVRCDWTDQYIQSFATANSDVCEL